MTLFYRGRLRGGSLPQKTLSSMPWLNLERNPGVTLLPGPVQLTNPPAVMEGSLSD